MYLYVVTWRLYCPSQLFILTENYIFALCPPIVEDGRNFMVFGQFLLLRFARDYFLLRVSLEFYSRRLRKTVLRWSCVFQRTSRKRIGDAPTESRGREWHRFIPYKILLRAWFSCQILSRKLSKKKNETCDMRRGYPPCQPSMGTPADAARRAL